MRLIIQCHQQLSAVRHHIQHGHRCVCHPCFTIECIAHITNLSTEATRRIDFDFSVAYSSDIDLVRKVLLATAANDESILQDPAPEVMISGHGDNAIQVKLRLWVAAENYWAVYFSMFEDVKKAFDQFGIQIPFPQLDVHMDK